MVASADKDAEKRDAVLRRMLATPKPGKGGKKEGGAKSSACERPEKGQKHAKSGT